jgi:hypothetical protein
MEHSARVESDSGILRFGYDDLLFTGYVRTEVSPHPQPIRESVGASIPRRESHFPTGAYQSSIMEGSLDSIMAFAFVECPSNK